VQPFCGGYLGRVRSAAFGFGDLFRLPDMLFLGVALSNLQLHFMVIIQGFGVVPLLTWERALSFSGSYALQVTRLELRSGEGRNLVILR
jgi:hypothetical protein